MALFNGEAIMNNRFYKFLILVVVSLFMVSVFSCLSEAKSSKQPVQPAVPKNSASSEKAAVKEPSASTKKAAVQGPNAPGPAPHIKFDKLVHDFCDVSPDSVNDCNFGFTNTGPGKLLITQTKGSCKCTVPELSRKDYAPGESGKINVQFHVPAYQGPASQIVFVSSNDPNNARVELTVRAYVRPKVKVEPEQITLSLLAPNAGAGQITLKSLDNEKFAIIGIDSEGGVFTIDFDPNNISDTHVLQPKVNVENLRKYLGGYLVMNLSHSACKVVRLQYNCPKQFEASPSIIIIRDAVIGQTAKRVIYLTSNYNEAIEIESITSDEGVIKVTGQEKTENRFKFDVDINSPPPLKGSKLRVFSDTLHIKIKDKGQIDVPCRGFYRPER
jgi:hypothetical protein